MFTVLPDENKIKIMHFVDGPTFMALSTVSSNLNTLARAYFSTELKYFYTELMNLQHLYCVKFHRSSWVLRNAGRGNIELLSHIINNNFAAIVIKQEDNKNILQIREKLTLGARKEAVDFIRINKRYGFPDIDHLEEKLKKDNEPKDFLIRSSFQASYWNLGDNFDMIIKPIDELQIEFENTSKLTSQEKKTILQCAGMANLRYKYLAKPENQAKLSNSIKVNQVNIIGRNGDQHNVDLNQEPYNAFPG
jgi:hypothetical protein